MFGSIFSKNLPEMKMLLGFFNFAGKVQKRTLHQFSAVMTKPHNHGKQISIEASYSKLDQMRKLCENLSFHLSLFFFIGTSIFRTTLRRGAQIRL